MMPRPLLFVLFLFLLAPWLSCMSQQQIDPGLGVQQGGSFLTVVAVRSDGLYVVPADDSMAPGTKISPRTFGELTPAEMALYPNASASAYFPPDLADPAREVVICERGRLVFTNQDPTKTFHRFSFKIPTSLDPDDFFELIENGTVETRQERNDLVDTFFSTNPIDGPTLCPMGICESRVLSFGLPTSFLVESNNLPDLKYAFRLTVVSDSDANCDNCILQFGNPDNYFVDRCGLCLPASSPQFGQGCFVPCDPQTNMTVASSFFSFDRCGLCLTLFAPDRNACVDACGVAFGDNTTCAVIDCTGEFNFPPIEDDACGVCGGRNKTCAADADLFVDFTFDSIDTSDLYKGSRACINDTLVLRNRAGQEPGATDAIFNPFFGLGLQLIKIVVLNGYFGQDVIALGGIGLEPGEEFRVDLDMLIEELVRINVLITDTNDLHLRIISDINVGPSGLGSSFVDVEVLPTSECFDCNMEKGGTATVDRCNQCLEQDSEMFNACVGCDDVAYGPGPIPSVDACGVCGGNDNSCEPCVLEEPVDIPELDEPYTPPGPRPEVLFPGPLEGLVDECGECVRFNDPLRDATCVDLCGVPNGNNTCPEVCTLPNGDLALTDSCGECGGGGRLCEPQTIIIPVSRDDGIMHEDAAGLFLEDEDDEDFSVCSQDRVIWRLEDRGGIRSGRFCDPTGLFDTGIIDRGVTPVFFELSQVSPAPSLPYELTYHSLLTPPRIRFRERTLRFVDCTGCDGFSRSRSTVDSCGVCTRPDDPDRNACIDCAGVPFGGREIDDCGFCLTPGVPPFNQECAGCDGVPNSGAVFDMCGNCTIPGSPEENSCFGCDGVPNSGFIVDPCTGLCLLESDPRFGQGCRDPDAPPLEKTGLRGLGFLFFLVGIGVFLLIVLGAYEYYRTRREREMGTRGRGRGIVYTAVSPKEGVKMREMRRY